VEISVNSVAMLVTPDGEWMDPDSDDFFAALGNRDPDYDAVTFAVKNLGFIKFSVIGRSIVEIELHPRNTALPAVLAVQQQMQPSHLTLFRIRYFDTTWHSEITASNEQAIVRLSQLTAPQFVEPVRQRFLVEPREYSHLFDDEDNELRFMAQKWRMSLGHFDSTLIPFAIKHHLLSRIMIIGVRGGAADPVYRFVGDSHSTWLDQQYHSSIIGERLGNIPDRDYGEWASQFHKDVARTGRPRFDCVTAAIEGQPTIYKSRYERLLLPWSTGGAEILVTVCNRRLRDETEPTAPLGSADISDIRNSSKSV